MYRKRSAKKFSWGKLIVLILVIVVIYGTYRFQQYQYFITTPVNTDSSTEQIFSIKKGENLKTIAQNLVDQKLLLDADSFILYGRFNHLDKQLKTGRFPLNQSLDTKDIFAVITSNKTRQEIITIPEGSTIEDIDIILTNLNLINSGEFTQAASQFEAYGKYPFLDQNKLSKLPHPLEGYLFPDTYYVSADNFSSSNFITQLLNTFVSKALSEAKKSSYPVDQVINVAAMVEKEANRDQDRPIIAGIIWKRLEQDWPLGIDATLLYLKDDREIDFQDLQAKGPYNTRLQTGLPPGPIANPGLASITAAATPQTTDYFFYLTSRDGDMVYAKTNAEHNSNKQKYL